MKAILESYALVSGQVINFEKSAMTFSKRTSAAKRNQIAQILGVNVVDKSQWLGGEDTFKSREGSINQGSVTIHP